MAKILKFRPRDPERSKEQILRASAREFAARGFDGARIDEIAAAAKLNKQMIYHYFGSKDDLFTAVLERAYRGIREAEAALPLEGLRADAAILRLVEFTWEYYLAHPDFTRLLNSENQHEARHIKASPNTRAINSAHRELMKQLAEQGRREGSTRADLDPTQLSINISALPYFYLINRHTLSTVFERDLGSKPSLSERLSVMRDVIRRWIAPAKR